MSNTTQLAAELADLQDRALEDAATLAYRLHAISDLHWQGLDDGPMFRVTAEVLRTLKEIEAMLAVPISEIESAS